jgi:hypothetical protein
MRLLKRIKRALAYARQGWYSFDWDHYYLLDLLRFKLRMMRDCFEAEAKRIDAAQIVAQLSRVIRALDRICEGEHVYCPEAEAEFIARWGQLVCPKCGGDFCKCWPQFGKDGSIVGYELRWEWTGAKTPEEQALARTERHALVAKQVAAHSEDLRRAMAEIAANLLDWWD